MDVIRQQQSLPGRKLRKIDCGQGGACFSDAMITVNYSLVKAFPGPCRGTEVPGIPEDFEIPLPG
jgi:hypothetical protein